MKPEYANTFGVRKVADKEGNILELTLDIAYKYMETAVTVTQGPGEHLHPRRRAGGQRGHEPPERHRSAQSADPDSARRDVKNTKMTVRWTVIFLFQLPFPAISGKIRC